MARLQQEYVWLRDVASGHPQKKMKSFYAAGVGKRRNPRVDT